MKDRQQPISRMELVSNRRRGPRARFTREEVFNLRVLYRDQKASIRELRRLTGANYATVMAALEGTGAYRDI